MLDVELFLPLSPQSSALSPFKDASLRRISQRSRRVLPKASGKAGARSAAGLGLCGRLRASSDGVGESRRDNVRAEGLRQAVSRQERFDGARVRARVAARARGHARPTVRGARDVALSRRIPSRILSRGEGEEGLRRFGGGGPTRG